MRRNETKKIMQKDNASKDLQKNKDKEVEVNTTIND